MKRPAVFFDRDNTLIHNDGFLGDPSKVVLVEGAAQAVARAKALGYATLTISNQSGVARGMFTEEDVQRVNARMDDLLAADHPQAVFDRHEFCPFHPQGNIDVYRRESDRRKPAPGMILSAAQKLDLDLAASWVIGDAARDIQAGRAAGCRTILLRLPDLPGLPAPPEAQPQEQNIPAETDSPNTPSVAADFTAHSLKEALDLIEQNAPKSSAESAPAPATDKPWLAAAQQARAAQSAAAPPPPPPAPSPGLFPGQKPVEDSAGPPPPRPSPPEASSTRLEELTEQLLMEMRRHHEHEQDHGDFSVTKLLAGIVQVMALGALLLAYLPGHDTAHSDLYAAIYLQTLTIALLIMGRQR